MIDLAVENERQLDLLNDSELERLLEDVDQAPTPPLARDQATQLREFHGWTLDKLEIFEMYLKMYRRVAGSGAFIDAFAGTGRGVARLGRGTQEVDGSSLIAAKSGAFASLDLVEMSTANVAALKESVSTLGERQRSRVRVHEGDSNLVIPSLLAVGELDPARPCFALLDQESTQLNWDTIEQLAGWKSYSPPPSGKGRPTSCKVELWILFNSHQVVNRLWPRDRVRYPESFSPDTLDRMMGGRSAWWDLWDGGSPSSALVHRFADRLRDDLGYVYAIPQIIKDPETGRRQYHMIHATDHPSAISFMRWAKRECSGFEDVALPGLEP